VIGCNSNPLYLEKLSRNGSSLEREKGIQGIIIYALATILEYKCLSSFINNWLPQIEKNIENPASLRSSYCDLVFMCEAFSQSEFIAIY